MRSAFAVAALGALLVFAAPEAAAQALTPSQVQEVVRDVEKLLQQHYVFPAMRPALVAKLRASLASGRYRVADPGLLAALVTEDIEGVAKDAHLGLNWNPPEYQATVRKNAAPANQAETETYWAEHARVTHHGLQEMRILPGNVRYLRITRFGWQADQTGTAYEGAMRFLKDGDAVIVDLRGNSGGEMSAVTYAISHFMPGEEEKVLLTSGERDKPEQTHVLSYLPAGRVKAPLYVLSDEHSVSAAEEFLYHVKSFRLGTIVGAKSAGAANNNLLYPVAPGFLLSVSVYSPRHGLTGTNWEGVGIEPDIATAPAQALDMAHKTALERLSAAAKSPDSRIRYAWTLDELDARLNPYVPGAADIARHAGRYGAERTVTLREGRLYYARTGQPESALTPMKPGLFALDGVNGQIRLRFDADRLTLLRSDGTSAEHRRTDSTADVAQDRSDVDKIIAEFIKPNSPGCSVAASKDGRTLFSRGFGLANIEHKVPITPSTRFDVGSVTKQFTAAAILLLAQDGKLSLGDDVRKYVPELPDYGSPVTIDHLLTHTAGLRDHPFLTELKGWWPEGRRQFEQDELVALINKQRHLNFRPGTSWIYSNSGYILAAEIVRRVSGQPLRAFMQKRIFEPLGMKSTELRDDSRQVIADQAAGYFRMRDDFKHALPLSGHGDGNLVTTTGDLLIWNEALDTGRLGKFVTTELQREAKAEDGRALRYGRGLFLGRYKGIGEVSHSGGAPGVTAFTGRYPEQRLAVAVVCNGSHPVDDTAHKIADLYLTGTTAEAATPSGAAVTLTPEQLSRFSGLFFDSSRGMHSHLSVKEGKLYWGRDIAEPLSGTRFRLPRSVELVFNTPDVLETVNTTTGDRRTFKRIDNTPPTKAQLQALAGTYKSDELGTTYRVEARDKDIVLHIVGEPELDWPLPPVARDLFDGGRDTIRFLRDRTDKGEAFLISNARTKELRFERVADR